MRNLLLALAEGGRSLLLIIFLIFFVLFLNLFFGCATPRALAIEAWQRNNAAIDALKDELRETPKGSEKESRIRQAIDALEKSNQDISQQVAAAEEAEKKATSEKKWLYIAIASALALGAVVVIKLF